MDDLMPAALPVESDSDDECDGPALTATQYLRRVRNEARAIPEVTYVTKRPSSTSSSHVDNPFVDFSKLSKPPENYKVTAEFQQNAISAFSQERLRLERLRCSQIKLPTTLPSFSDVAALFLFCFGGVEKAVEVYLDDEDDEDSCDENEDEHALHNDSGDEAESDSYRKVTVSACVAEAHQPTDDIICSLSQPQVDKLINYHLKWFEATGYTELQGRWFYAMFAALEKPLNPDTCSTLRQIAKRCAEFRALLAAEDSRNRSLSLLICLVARYFGQTDLAE